MAVGSFDVQVPVLRHTAVRLAGDGEAVMGAGAAAAGAARSAGDGAGGGALAEASAEFAQVLADRVGQVGAAAVAAGSTMAGNAAVYDATDGATASGFGALPFGTGVSRG